MILEIRERSVLLILNVLVSPAQNAQHKKTGTCFMQVMNTWQKFTCSELLMEIQNQYVKSVQL